MTVVKTKNSLNYSNKNLLPLLAFTVLMLSVGLIKNSQLFDEVTAVSKSSVLSKSTENDSVSIETKTVETTKSEVRREDQKKKRN